MTTKTEQVVKHLENGDINKATKLLKGFKHGITKDEKRVLELTHEMKSENRRAFYKQLGISYEDTCKQFCEIVNRIWLADSDKIIIFINNKLVVKLLMP